MERNVGNLFFSDNVKVYCGKVLRSAILIIHHGFIYFVVKDDGLLSSAPWLRPEGSKARRQRSGKDPTTKMLIYPAFHVFDDVKRVIMPRQSQRNHLQVAFQL